MGNLGKDMISKYRRIVLAFLGGGTLLTAMLAAG
jgi:hypothetical protein